MRDYKLSDYNYTVEGTNGELLLMNTLHGRYSLLCLKNEKAESVRLLMDNAIYSNDLEHSLKEVLIEKQYLVESETKEEVLIENNANNIFDCNVLRLIILPTGQCNFRCKYCYEDFEMGRMTEDVQQGIINYVKKNIHKYSTLRISWFGGEPLLTYDIIEYLSMKLIEICEKNNRSYVADITSNGYLLDEAMMRKLLKHRIYSYQITLDGLEKTHNFNKPLLNGNATFQKIIDNIKHISKNIKTGRFQFAIRTNITVDMINEITDYYEYINSIIGNDKRFSSFIRIAGDWGYNNDIDKISEKFVGEDGFKLLLEQIDTNNLFVNLTDHIKYFVPNGYVCYASYKNSYVITPEGVIEKCTCHLNDKRNQIGILHKDGVMEMDEYLAALWITVKIHNDDCKTCNYTPICSDRGCPARRIILGHDSSNICCPPEKASLSHLIRILFKNNKEIFQILE